MRASILAFLFLFCPLQAQAPLPKGELIPRVVCASDSRFSYALYLPRDYREDRVWPVLFGFSPIAYGEEPVKTFQKAAERFGWIVVGSNDSRNGPLRPALEASEAMWKDVRARFKVDPKRSYGYGFSGGSRMALRLALKHPKDFAGLISMGAFGVENGSLAGLGHLYFHMSCGLEDFNHWELLEGRKELQSRGWKALSDRFEGGHRAPHEGTAMVAMTFLQLGAMQRGMLPKDEALETEFRHTLELEATKAGDTLLALRRWNDLAVLYPDSAEGRLATIRASALEKEPSVLEELKLEAAYEQASKELSELPKDAKYRQELVRYLDRLKVASPVEQRMIRCLLGVPIQNYQIALGEAFQKKSWDQLLALSTSLAALDERAGWPCVYAAIAHVQLGKPGEALSHLKAARLRGYRNVRMLQSLEELKPLRDDPDFQAILKAMETAP